MPDPFPQRPVPLRACVAALLALSPLAQSLAATSSSAEELQPAVAAVTSHRGKIQYQDSKGANRAVHTRAILPIHQAYFGTKPQGSLFLSLSNGVGIGLGESTSARIIEYQQAAINPSREDLKYESSVSNLQIQLEAGVLAVSIYHLNPLSNARIDLPSGYVIIHSGQFLFTVGPDSTSSVTALKGTATFYNTKTKDREFIAPGNCISITTASADRPEILSNETSDEISQQAQRLLAATEHSRLRVLFRHNPEKSMPLAEWILPEDHFGRPSTRPYQFELK